MVEQLWCPEATGTPEEAAALAGRLRSAAQSLTTEYPELSPDAAERLIFDVAHELLSAAQVAQFVPTLATRRARQMLRRRQCEIVVPEAPIEPERSIVVGAPAPAGREPVSAGASAPPRPPAYYASEAKRLLEKARTLRANTLLAAGGSE